MILLFYSVNFVSTFIIRFINIITISIIKIFKYSTALEITVQVFEINLLALKTYSCSALLKKKKYLCFPLNKKVRKKAK